MSLIAVLTGTCELSPGGGGQLPATRGTASTTRPTASCSKGLHPQQRGTGTPGTQHHSSTSFSQGWTPNVQGRQNPGRKSFWQWQEAESKLLRCCAPTNGPWCVPLQMEMDMSQGVLLLPFCSLATWESISLAMDMCSGLASWRRPNHGHPRPTSSMWAHSPGLHCLHLSQPSGPATPTCLWRNRGSCVENRCVANNDGHWDRTRLCLPALPALIWGMRIRRKQGRAKGDIWLLEPLAPISTYQVKILASS